MIKTEDRVTDKKTSKKLSNLYLITINHKTAPIVIREKFSICEKRLEPTYSHIKEQAIFKSFLILSTCNRTEFFFRSDDFNSAYKTLILFLKNTFNIEENILSEYAEVLSGENVVNHTFNLASGLESLIIGERQILSQIKDSYSLAQKENTLCDVLEKLFQLSISCAKDTHKLTNISKGQQSVSSAAVDIANQLYGPIKNKNIMVLGAGRMAELALERITNLGGAKHTYVLNRSPHKIISFSDIYKIDQTFPFSDVYKTLNDVDILICAAGAPHFILFSNLFKLGRKDWNKRLTIIDISLPRNIDSTFRNIPNVELIDIDSLQKLYNKLFFVQDGDLEDVEEILETGKNSFYNFTEEKEDRELIKILKEKFENIRSQKISKLTEGKSSFTSEELDYITKNILNTVLHEPFTNIKTSKSSKLLKEKIIREMFGV